MEKFKYAIENKRYHTWNYYLRQKYNTKVFKVSINAGFTCPNIDGSISRGGCTYCSKEGSGDFAGNPKDDLVTQFQAMRLMMENTQLLLKFIPAKISCTDLRFLILIRYYLYLPYGCRI